jgi:hypothetical protein
LESPDLPVCIVDVEAENRISLRDFSRVMLRRFDGQPYAHSMLIEGNDDRGINVGLMTKTGFDIDTVRTHIFIFDLGQNDLPIFSRDCVSTSCAPRPARRCWCWSTTSKASAVAPMPAACARPPESKRSSCTPA